MRRSSAPLRALVLLLVFAIVLIAGAYRFFANPQVPQGGSASFPATGAEAPASGTWDVLNPSGVAIANSGAANGWSVSLSGSTFTVGAPTSAPIAASYKVRYGGAVVINPDARSAQTPQGGVTPQPAGGQSAPFDVIAGVVGPPPAPAGLTAVGGTAKATLTWTASAGATGYKLKRATTAGGPYATVATNVASPYVNAGLTNGAKVYFVVTATGSGGESGNSNEANATPIAVPTNVVATAGNAQVALSWSAAAGATGYKVKVGTTPGNYPTVVTSAGASATVTGLTNGTAYYFVVTGTNTVGESDPSAQISATPSAPATPPVAPTNVSAVGGTAKATVSWTASPGATAYAVKYGTASGSYTGTASGTSPLAIPGLINGTKVYAVVVASNAAGSSPNSTEASATPIAVPTNVVATPGNGQVALTWSASAGATGYKVKFGTASGGPYTGTASPTGTSTTVVGLANGTPYYFVVTGTNTVGESNPSAQVSSRPVPPPPGAPTGLTATAVSASQVNLAWTDNATNETGFLVERKTGTTGTYAQVGTAGANVTTYQNTSGLSASTLYTYRVRATNAGGNSAYSNEASATTQAAQSGGAVYLKEIVIDNDCIVGGGSVLAVARLSSPATTATVVQLRVSDTFLSAPPAVTVPAGSRDVTFSVSVSTNGDLSGYVYGTSGNWTQRARISSLGNPSLLVPSMPVLRAGNGGVWIDWKALPVDALGHKLAGYRVVRFSGSTQTVLNSMLTVESAFVDAGLASGTYGYRVDLIGGDGAVVGSSGVSSVTYSSASPRLSWATTPSTSAQNLAAFFTSNPSNATSFVLIVDGVIQGGGGGGSANPRGADD